MSFMTPTIVVATSNKGKLVEIQSAAVQHSLDYTFRGIFDLLPQWESPIEDGDSFEANAAIKAHAGFNALGLPTLADDSGLVVDILGGAPGVYSSSYGGVEGDDARNNAKLLAELSATEDQAHRSARFAATLVLVGLDKLLPAAPNYLVATGSCEGSIAHAAQGDKGFGYDPLFLPQQTPGRSMAQLDMQEKNAISHRGAALESLMGLLRQY
ncbi:MAG: RdgB/HAM1 family non-canonical purine NTP pyrophosphatase [Coriobacteriia bacterium]|nr:RdgB/HAM1 family non-canonical purine NTP pyrophosphatase [Coriobacteriia bacterium]